MSRLLIASVLALGLAACSTAPASDASTSDGARRRPLSGAETCKMLVDVAHQVGKGPFDGDVKSGDGKIDCWDTFQSAGLDVFGASRMNSPNVADSPQDRGYVFSAPEFTDDTVAVIKMDFVCRNLCGHGEELTVELQGGRWKITNRKTTWIS